MGDLQQRGTAHPSAPAILHSKPGSTFWVQLCHCCLLRKGRSISYFSLSVLIPLLCRLHFQPAFADGHPAGAEGAGKHTVQGGLGIPWVRALVWHLNKLIQSPLGSPLFLLGPGRRSLASFILVCQTKRDTSVTTGGCRRKLWGQRDAGSAKSRLCAPVPTGVSFCVTPGTDWSGCL